MKISCSLLTCSNRYSFLKSINNTDIDYIHIDVMDGKFVDNKQYKIDEILKLNDISLKKLDVHLMVDNPLNYIEKLSLCNIEYITIHKEIKKDINKLLDIIKSYGFKCGLSIKPDTSIDSIIPYLPKLDLVLVMSVEPGMGGQTFIVEVLDKISTLKEKINELNLKTIISVDGGINDENILSLNNIGTDMVVVGSYLTSDKDYENKIKMIKDI